jgi:hypothetical protein
MKCLGIFNPLPTILSMGPDLRAILSIRFTCSFVESAGMSKPKKLRASNEAMRALKIAELAFQEEEETLSHWGRAKRHVSASWPGILILLIIGLLGSGFHFRADIEKYLFEPAIPHFKLASSNLLVGIPAEEPCEGLSTCLMVYIEPNCELCEEIMPLVKGLKEFATQYTSPIGIKIVVGGGTPNRLKRLAHKVPGEAFIDYEDVVYDFFKFRGAPAYVLWNSEGKKLYHQYGSPGLKGSPDTQAQAFLNDFVIERRGIPTPENFRSSDFHRNGGEEDEEDEGNFITGNIKNANKTKKALDNHNNETIETAEEILRDLDE